MPLSEAAPFGFISPSFSTQSFQLIDRDAISNAAAALSTCIEYLKPAHLGESCAILLQATYLLMNV
jgi:hypothetical protein